MSSSILGDFEAPNKSGIRWIDLDLVVATLDSVIQPLHPTVISRKLLFESWNEKLRL